MSNLQSLSDMLWLPFSPKGSQSLIVMGNFFLSFFLSCVKLFYSLLSSNYRQYLNGRDKIVEEKSKCVLIVHCDDDSKLQYICDSFKTMYGQESVLISSTISKQCLRSSSTPTCNDIESMQVSIQKLATENRSLIEELHQMQKRVSQVEERSRQHHLSPVSLYSSIAFFAVLSILCYMFYLVLSSWATGIPLQTWKMTSWIFPSIALFCLWMMWCTHALPLLFHEQAQRPPSCSSSAIP